MRKKFANKRKKKIIFKKLIIIFIFFSFSITFISYIAYRYIKNINYISPLPLLNKTEPFFIENQSFENELKYMLNKQKIPYLYVYADKSSSYVVKLQTGEDILFNLSKSLDSQVSSLQLIYNRLKIEGKEFSKLDLRFDRPIILSK